ncbi:MAG: TetR/AcrR family transcriptional regulator [Verrucomicrobiaceae bacterium]|nr:MAG: TetR/AcrR family transcriptional regulator [Verrucomicrobiaceae bacterium]
MRQRKKQPQLTRRTILEAAGAEFSRHGYAGTGLGAIVSRAELTKGALFHHFSDKRAMAVAWIEDLLAPALEERWMVPLEEVRSLDALRAFSRARCMELAPDDATSALVSLTSETAASDAVLGEALEKIFARWRESLAALLERGKTEGWIHRSIQPAAEAAFVVSAFAGFTVTTRTHPEEGIRRTCASALEGYLETLRAQ